MNDKLAGTLFFGVFSGLVIYGMIDSFGVKGVLAGIVIGAYIALSYPWMMRDLED